MDEAEEMRRFGLYASQSNQTSMVVNDPPTENEKEQLEKDLGDGYRKITVIEARFADGAINLGRQIMKELQENS